MMNSKLKYISISILVCLLVGFIDAIITQSGFDGWYLALQKPGFTPPNWLFGPVWTVLYMLMGIALGLVWNKGLHHVWVKTALYHFGFQLLLNTAWSIVFFGLKLPLLSLIIIISLFILVLFTIRWFKVVSPLAAYLLIPYIVWLGFIAVLNYEIWRLN
ncbi:TspO/MBR family protein [Mesonia sp. MT50]|uniref:TspO/MBR family protein n=2 Tax=Flavobacteriaceae TaxID=49546 RepID=A0ABU1A2I0_9FLAO|nr:TspO/MBR family protein [Mesonia profundi]MDQ7917914.1 TspO/MBR family protein [Mesonia profundi]